MKGVRFKRIWLLKLVIWLVVAIAAWVAIAGGAWGVGAVLAAFAVSLYGGFTMGIAWVFENPEEFVKITQEETERYDRKRSTS